MECPMCRSKQITRLDRWGRQCQKCGHRWTATRHTEVKLPPNDRNKEEPTP